MFKSRFKALRLKNGLSQTELAKALEVSKQTISNWETGKAKPKLKSIIKITKYFNVRANYILCLDNIQK